MKNLERAFMDELEKKLGRKLTLNERKTCEILASKKNMESFEQFKRLDIPKLIKDFR